MSPNKSLFDPFFGSIRDVVWNKGGKGAANFRVIGQNIPDEAASLAKQFGGANPGWAATLITLKNVNTSPWASPSKSGILERLVAALLPPIHNGCMIVLPEGKLLLMLQHIHGEDLAKVVQEINRHLSGEGNIQPAEFQVMSLEHPNPVFTVLCNTIANPKPQQVQQAPEYTPSQLTTFHLDHNQLRIRRDRTLFRILIIEDDPATAMLLSQLVSNTCQVSVAHDSIHGVAMYKDLVPNLVFLDIGLPDVDGLTLAKRIHDADAASFVVMITANAFKNNLDASVAAGAKGFIAKPFNRERIQYYLNLAHQQKYE